MKKFRVFNDDCIGAHTQVFLVDTNTGEEIEISGAIYKIKLDLDVNDINQAKIHISAYADLDVSILPEGVTVVQRKDKKASVV